MGREVHEGSRSEPENEIKGRVQADGGGVAVGVGGLSYMHVFQKLMHKNEEKSSFRQIQGVLAP